jgi:hypothetical protein
MRTRRIYLTRGEADGLARHFSLVEEPRPSEVGAGNVRDTSEKKETLEKRQATSLEPNRAGSEVIEAASKSDEENGRRARKNMTKEEEKELHSKHRELLQKTYQSQDIMETTSSPLVYAENLITLISANESLKKISNVSDEAVQELLDLLSEESSEDSENETGKTGVEKTRRSVPESIVFPEEIRALLTRIQDDDNMTFSPQTRKQLTSWVESMKKVKKNDRRDNRPMRKHYG